MHTFEVGGHTQAGEHVDDSPAGGDSWKEFHAQNQLQYNVIFYTF